jgi:CBS domain-containing protein
MERLADVLGHKYPQFNTTSPDHLVSDALYQMAAENVDYLIVYDDNRFTGIISSNDIANKVLLADRPLKQVKVGDCTNRSLPIATLTDSIEYAMELLERYNTKYLAVYDSFDFKGIVTSYDLMQQILSKRQKRTMYKERPLL